MRLFLIGLLLSASSLSNAQSVIKGYVFEDLNGNGKKDKKEAGLKQVSVSNGIDVVQTDDKGFYSLNVSNDAIVFVIKPSGYKTRINENNLPQYHYIHKPKGSPDSLKYKGVSPTGIIPESVDFALQKQNEPNEFTTIVFGDPQVYTEEEIDFFQRGIISELEGVKDVPFGISLGDLVGDQLELHPSYINAIKKIGIPWYNVMGNHDMNFDVVLDSLSDETFEKNFGPSSYAFNYGNVHFMVLDDILYPDPRDGKSYWGGFRPSQIEFIKNNLKYVSKDKLVVLAYHIPIQFHNDEFSATDRQKLFDILKDFPHVLTMCAHTHLQRNDFYTEADGWHGVKPLHEYNAGTTCGDWYSGELDAQNIPKSVMRDGTPKGYAFVHFDNNQYIIDYKIAGQAKDKRMEIHVPKVIPNKGWISYRAYVNYYMGSKNDLPHYRIDNGDWKIMTMVDDKDPAYVASLVKWDYADQLMAGRRSSNAVDCSHLWEASFPRNMSVGTHTIEVRITDRYGRTFSESKTFSVQEPLKIEKP